MRHELQVAAQDLGLDDKDEPVGTVLSVFLHRLPSGERNHVLVHLPADVRALIDPVAPHGPAATWDSPRSDGMIGDQTSGMGGSPGDVLHELTNRDNPNQVGEGQVHRAGTGSGFTP